METKQRSLIVIDDEIDLNDLLVQMIKELGYKVFSAKDGVEALGILMENDIDAALCDISMPAMNGLELLTYLRAKGKNTPFVFLTGHASFDYILSAVQLGVTEFLQKPFNEERLSRSIARVLDIGMRISRINTNLQKLASQNSESEKLVDTILKDSQQIERLKASALLSA